MHFSAQSDAWSLNWRERTGILLDDYAQKWTNLPTYPKDPTLHVGSPLDRDPNIPAELRKEHNDLEKAHLDAGNEATYVPN